MQSPELPRDEETRLKRLRSLGILDTAPEERFDRLTRLAKRMFGVPIALVSLVDENRQWFKSCIGLEASETPRNVSFCGHAILGNEIFIIADATLDERFADNPLVLNEPKIRFYAGCPLRDISGSMQGTLCIIDTRPRKLNAEDLDAFKDLAELAERELMAIQLATLDDLTGIFNRRGFVALAQNSLNLCIRQGIPASMVFFDLNGFKPINDEFGHAEGDRALITFADHMRASFRDSDLFARLGGDEFAALLTNSSMEQAEQSITRFRQRIQSYNTEANRGYDVHFCDGIVTVQGDEGHSIDVLLKRADALMYEKKRTVVDGCNK